MMLFRKKCLRLLGSLSLAVLLGDPAARAAIGSPTPQPGTDVFVGSSPGDSEIKDQLGIGQDEAVDLIEWRIALHQGAQSALPATYELEARYGLAVPNTPGLGETGQVIRRTGNWSLRRGTPSDPNAVVYVLNDAVSLYQVSPDVMHLLGRDDRFLVGNGGWSYTLSRRRPPVTPIPGTAGGLEGRQLTPLSTGPEVFGIYEGRTPAIEIAQVLRSARIPQVRIKWRLTLFHDPGTGRPTTYKLEGSLHPNRPRIGTWELAQADDPRGGVIRLEEADGEEPMLLLKGSDDVLFVLDGDGKPLVGNSTFSYTLNRRE